MANNSASQQSLAEDSTFRRRIKDALSYVAMEIIDEPDDIPFHKEREEYARRVALPNLDSVANQISSWLVNRVNISSFETSYSFEGRATITASGDPDIRSQIKTDWNVIAGIDDTVVVVPE